MSTFSIYQDDAKDTLAKYFHPNVFDGCLCDPPYGYAAFTSKKKRPNDWETRGTPSILLWDQVFRVLKPGALLMAATGARTYHNIASSIEQAGFEIKDMFGWIYHGANATHCDTGVRLRPAIEPYVVALKPREGTVAQNKKRWGLGGTFNVVDCRVNGHLPSDLAMDETAASLVDMITGKTVSSFFYCGKAGPKERDDHDHPTPKPLALTEYLARLIKPHDHAQLLVPFSGVGSEMIGGLRAGWQHVVGAELETKYVNVARRRIPRWCGTGVKEV